ncbi:MAG: ATP-binding protein [Deltaproteobacteria bacterium]|nr:ATP-binding protein [Deltaproteobacteria bacterium]
MFANLRPFWTDRLTQCWQAAPIAWLAGVRRVGKTTLARSLADTTFVNCDLPESARRLHDPVPFLRSVQTPILVLDEVHQLPDPSRLLKIAADEFPTLRVLATGSSTLAATAKFRDALTGRKRVVRMQPVLADELAQFGVRDLRKRLLHGGLPPTLLAERRDPEFYAEWLDSYFARDVQELFRVERRGAYLRLAELLLRQSGGMADVASLARAVELSRPTVMNYLEALAVTQVIHVVRPFHGGGRQELLHRPRIYGFDTGFVAFANGWNDLRDTDCGALWEHLTLESLLAWPGLPEPHFWRDKEQREVDFVLPHRDGSADAIECKWTSSAFSPKGLTAMRSVHPLGRNFVVATDVDVPYARDHGALQVHYVGLAGLGSALRTAPTAEPADGASGN